MKNKLPLLVLWHIQQPLARVRVRCLLQTFPTAGIWVGSPIEFLAEVLPVFIEDRQHRLPDIRTPSITEVNFHVQAKLKHDTIGVFHCHQFFQFIHGKSSPVLKLKMQLRCAPSLDAMMTSSAQRVWRLHCFHEPQ